jgi:hypothetical protein
MISRSGDGTAAFELFKPIQQQAQADRLLANAARALAANPTGGSTKICP